MRISLLIDSPMVALIQAIRGVDPAIKREIGKHTKAGAEPIWSEATRAQGTTRPQVRLADSARVGVTGQNVFLRAGQLGILTSGTPISVIAEAVEFGASPDKQIHTRSRKGTNYTRRLGGTFRLPRRGGYVAHPAAGAAIPRIASLWLQTARRTIHEQIEKV